MGFPAFILVQPHSNTFRNHRMATAWLQNKQMLMSDWMSEPLHEHTARRYFQTASLRSVLEALPRIVWQIKMEIKHLNEVPAMCALPDCQNMKRYPVLERADGI